MNPSLAPLKRFGQNFLNDQNIIKKIVDAVPYSKKTSILEIGPGLGALTFEFLPKVRQLVAVEVDRRFCEILSEETKECASAKIICKDILKFDIKKYARLHAIPVFKVIGNLPYYITTPILEHLFKNINFVEDIFITVQKEVGARLTASVGSKDYSSLTCFANYFCTPEVLFKIKKGSFWPAPKVDSCFLRLKPKTRKERGFSVESEKFFFAVVRSAFGQRRKKLYTSLSKLVPKDVLKESSFHFLLDRRAEELKLSDFAQLSNSLSGLIKSNRLNNL